MFISLPLRCQALLQRITRPHWLNSLCFKLLNVIWVSQTSPNIFSTFIDSLLSLPSHLDYSSSKLCLILTPRSLFTAGRTGAMLHRRYRPVAFNCGYTLDSHQKYLKILGSGLHRSRLWFHWQGMKSPCQSFFKTPQVTLMCSQC